MFVITISGPVVVTDDATDKPIPVPAQSATFHGLHFGRETRAEYRYS